MYISERLLFRGLTPETRKDRRRHVNRYAFMATVSAGVIVVASILA